MAEDDIPDLDELDELDSAFWLYVEDDYPLTVSSRLLPCFGSLQPPGPLGLL